MKPLNAIVSSTVYAKLSLKTPLATDNVAQQSVNKAGYTATSVACGWAGAVMSLCKPQNCKIRDQKQM